MSDIDPQSEDVKVDDSQAEDTKAPELTATEIQASESGWVPKEEWVASGRDENDWRPAKEFVERGELFKHISSTKRELKQTQAALTALQKHHQFVYEKAHQAALKDLRLERRHALANEDVDRVEEIEEEIDTLKSEHAAKTAALAREASVEAAPDNPMFTNWTAKNSWYETDTELREFADAMGIVYVSKHPESKSNPQIVLDHISTEIRKKFPEKFGTQRRAAPNAVASVDRSGKAGPQVRDIELDETEREIMNNLVRSGVMTEKEYKTQLKKAKETK